MLISAIFLGIIIALALSAAVGSSLYLVAIGIDFSGFNILQNMSGNIVWNTMNDYLLVAIPLFILLGEILTRSGLADRLYTSLALWVRWLPGQLLHANILASTLFAATSGSSVATAATIGTVAQPTMLRLKYNERTMLGSIAAGGTLGILIPPSIPMIVYGALTNTSVSKLFAAGILPGIVLAATMSLIVIIKTLVSGEKPLDTGRKPTAAELLVSLKHLLPIAILFIVIMGTIYTGIGTPTESAAFGVLAALVLAGLNRSLSIKVLHECFLSTLRTSAMMVLVLVGAFLLNFILSFAGIPQDFANWVASLGIGRYETIWVLVAFYFVLGCFLESLSMVVTTIGVVFPMVTALGFDPVWLGIFLVLMMELSQITPPVGLNLFVVQSIRVNKSGNIKDVYLGVGPFVLAMLIFVAVLIYFPSVALWLPTKFS
jgi:tripartite ATP-independent transporter DctM subunit